MLVIDMELMWKVDRTYKTANSLNPHILKFLNPIYIRGPPAQVNRIRALKL